MIRTLKTSLGAGIASLLAFAGVGFADPVASVDDLEKCELPHGIALLPEERSPEVRRLGGVIFRCSTGKYASVPRETEDGQRLRAPDIYALIRKDQLGDLCYSRLNKGTLVAWSGRLADLGEGMLAAQAGRRLLDPPVVYSKEERSGDSPKGYEGMIEFITEGRCYLLKTTDEKYALVRLLEMGKDGALIQWVLQPDGGRTFAIPAGAPVDYVRRWKPPATDGAKTPPPANVPNLHVAAVDVSSPARFAAALEQHLCNRQSVAEALIGVVRTGHGPEKARAIKALGEMRVAAAAPVLAADIGWMDRWAVRSEVTIDNTYPCVPALVSIGIPGASAAIKELSTQKPTPDTGHGRRKLLASVVQRVYGKKAAGVVLHEAIATAKTDEERANLQEALKVLPDVPGWR